MLHLLCTIGRYSHQQVFTHGNIGAMAGPLPGDSGKCARSLWRHGIFMHRGTEPHWFYFLAVSYPPTIITHTLIGPLSMLPHSKIQHGLLTIQPWTPQFESVGYTTIQSAEIGITGLPCSACSPEVIEYILGSFSSVRAHITIADNALTLYENIIYTCRCSIWCTEVRNIPSHLRIKKLPVKLSNPWVFSDQPATILQAIEANIKIQIN